MAHHKTMLKKVSRMRALWGVCILIEGSVSLRMEKSFQRGGRAL